MWSTFRHPNVLPLLGVNMTGPRYAMVSEWMVNGNINEFVEKHPEADRLGLVGVPSEAPVNSVLDDRLISVAAGRR